MCAKKKILNTFYIILHHLERLSKLSYKQFLCSFNILFVISFFHANIGYYTFTITDAYRVDISFLPFFLVKVFFVSFCFFFCWHSTSLRIICFNQQNEMGKRQPIYLYKTYEKYIPKLQQYRALCRFQNQNGLHPVKLVDQKKGPTLFYGFNKPRKVQYFIKFVAKIWETKIFIYTIICKRETTVL